MIKWYMLTEQILYFQHCAQFYNTQKVVAELLAYITYLYCSFVRKQIYSIELNMFL